MSIEFKTGDLFDTTQPAIGHGVNVYGVMGSGIAPLIRKRYPVIFEPYKRACKTGFLKPGMVLPVQVSENFWVLNIASQRRPGADASYEWLEESIRASYDFLDAYDITGFAVPRIGAGIGGLDWAAVKALLIEVSEEYPHITLEVWSLPGAGD